MRLRRLLYLMTLAGLAMVAAVACGDDGEKTTALARVEVLQARVGELEASGQAEITALARVEVVEAARAELEVANSDLEQTLAGTAQELLIYADTVGQGCVRLSRYVNDGDDAVVFRIKVYDPATGEAMDDTTLKSVVVSLADGQSFEADYAGHGRPEPTDFFWATAWEIAKGYPTGTMPFEVTATAIDGRTGEFTEVNVATSLLAIVEAQ